MIADYIINIAGLYTSLYTLLYISYYSMITGFNKKHSMITCLLLTLHHCIIGVAKTPSKPL